MLRSTPKDECTGEVAKYDDIIVSKTGSSKLFSDPTVINDIEKNIVDIKKNVGTS